MNASPTSSPGLPVTALCELAGITLLLRLVSAFQSAWLPAGSFAIFLFAYVPMFHYRSIGWPAWATTIADRKGAVATLFGAALVGCAAYFLWVRLPLPAFLKPGVALPIAHPVSFALQQLSIALSEEIFFRGYLHDAFERHGRRPLLPTALLFAVAHLAIAASPWRALTFFPALLFGWSRKRTGSVYVPAALHFGFNLLPAVFGG